MVPDRLTAQEAKQLGIAGKLIVCVDGIERHGIAAFCMSEGWVDYYPKDDEGQYLVDGDSFVMKRITGKVEVELEND